MKVETAIRKIDKAIEENINDKRGYFSQRIGYEISLKEIEKVAGGEAVEKLTRWIKEEIKNGTKPKNKSVRNQAFVICAKKDIIVPKNSFLWT